MIKNYIFGAVSYDRNALYQNCNVFINFLYTIFFFLGGGQSKLTLKRIYYKLWENWIEKTFKHK